MCSERGKSWILLFAVVLTSCNGHIVIAPSTKRATSRLHMAIPVHDLAPANEMLQMKLIRTGLQLISGLTCYAGLVWALDRPQGGLDNDVRLGRDVEVKPSSVAGLGLFAVRPLPKGTVLGTYPGILIPLNDQLPKVEAYPHCEAYVWRFSDSRFIIDPTNALGNLEETCFGGRAGTPGSVWFLRKVLGPMVGVSTALCRINEPPRGADVNVVTEEQGVDGAPAATMQQQQQSSTRSVLVRLERNVQAGEELFMDYGLTYDRSRYGPVPVELD